MSKVKHIGTSDFDMEIKEGRSLVVFWAPWCNPCKVYANTVEQAADMLAEDAKVFKINIDDNVDLIQRLGVRAVPCSHLFDNGDYVTSTVGASKTATELKEWTLQAA